ncbi:MAG: NAD(P)/FAD-dependent oxidoreductase [Thermoplasmatales archaeon]|nr:MAG: NAD(P)/FAD-dependent oxidoreductase [Thermoplasmatales archaeon]
MKCDIVVVGAGPAGSTAAKYLAKKNFEVVLVDKHKFPRPKPCGGGVPIGTVKRFPYVEDYNLIDSFSYGGFIHSPSLKYSIELNEEKPIVAMVSREKFDHGLVNIAVDSGATFVDEKRVKDVHISKENARVVLQDGSSIESKMLVGADGVSSVVAKKSGLATCRMINVCVFQEYLVGERNIVEYATEQRLCHIHLMYHGIPGYAWIFPKKDRFNIGVGEFMPYKKYAPKSVRLRDVYKSYFQMLKQKSLIPKDLGMGRCRGGSIPVFPLEKTYAYRLLLCGDAAGFINPISGGGIHFAMESGELAARVIAKSLESDNFNDKFLMQYQRLWKEAFGKDLDTFARFINIWLRQTERFIRIACKDKRFIHIASEFLYGNLRIRDYRSKILLYYLQDWMKDLFGML